MLLKGGVVLTENIVKRFAANEALTVVAKTEGKVIVVGEGMDAVKTAAQLLKEDGVNAKWYQAWRKNFPVDRLMTPEELEGALARNERWIVSKIKEGYKIYDIGIDAERAARSPFYQLKDILAKYNYPTIPLDR